jgi:pimeloyl-ACP methyl ester carboxylesterase
MTVMSSKSPAQALPAAVRAWREGGRFITLAGQQVFVSDTGSGPGRPVVIVHGFPGSSFDWHEVVPRLAAHRRVVIFDLLGYGLSAKPTSARYSLFEQTELAEAVVAGCGVERCVLIGHDMGDTVVAELLHRHNRGKLAFTVEGVILTNGSIFIDMARLSRGQRLALALPGRTLPVSIPTRFLRRSLMESFAPGAPPPPGAVDAMVALLRHGGGARLLPRQIRYLEERRTHQGRWTAALVDYPGLMTAIWGERDPIAVVAMVRRLRELRPQTEVLTWPDVGHWPCIEVPDRLAGAIIDRL